MKYSNVLLLSLSLLGGAWVSAQTSLTSYTNELGQKVTVQQAESFKITTPASTWPVISDQVLNEEREEIRNDRDRSESLLFNADQQPVLEDPVLQTNPAFRSSRAPMLSFNGQSGSGYPPDPSGAAGPNHYVQAVNTVYRIYNKSGIGVAGPFNLSSLWSGSNNLGDPIVMYDRHADRWFISQFNQNPNRILIAVSQTNDPTGAYYAYSFTMSSFPDYPKYSVWWDGYYMSSNSSNTAVVFEREKMLAGDASAQMIALSLPNQRHGGFRGALPSDADGDMPPNGTPCYFFNLSDNGFGGGSVDQIQVWNMITNWSLPSATQVVASTPVSVPAFDAVFTGGFANISQPGTSQRLDVIQGVLMFRAQHRTWTGYNTMVLTHAVDLGSNRSGIRWYELRDADNGIWQVHQSGTWAPDNTASRWMSSAAMDDLGNIGMAYSICDASNTMYPSLAYTGRLASDALGDMSYHEQFAVNGTASQKNIDRFGDYAHLSLDPDGKTFWYTGEYIGGSNNGTPRTRIFKFSIEDEAGITNPYYSDLGMIAYVNGEQLMVQVEGIHGNENVQLDLVTMFGQTIERKADLDVTDGRVNNSFSTSELATGTYFVRVGNQNFQKVVKVVIQ